MSVEPRQSGREARSVRLPGAVAIAVLAALLAAFAGPLVAGETADKKKSRPDKGTTTPRPDYELEKPIPDRLDVFDLNLRQTRRLSATKNFRIVGHNYLRGPWLTPAARDAGLGAGFNTPRVYDGVGYFAGYDNPIGTVFGVVIADVSDPRDIRPLSFVPCNPGTRCPYLRVNNEKKVLVFGNDSNPRNPNRPPEGEPVRAGMSFWDVSDPRNPEELSFVETRPDGATHGFTIDDRYAYGCASAPESKTGATGANQELQIIDYADPENARLVGRLHIEGQHVGEEFAPQDRQNPDGTEQLVWCHEIDVVGDRLYIAWRDAGMIVVDVSDRTNPTIISRLDYVPPFNGGSLGAAHSAMPIMPHEEGEEPSLLLLTDEIFDCPPGFGRVVDISVLSNPQIISSFRIPAINDNYDHETGEFVCPEGQQSIHMPWFDHRAPGLAYVSWYDQGLRAWDFSNPFLPKEVGYFISPQYAVPGVPPDRHTREAYQDPETDLIYVTDGNGGGVTVLRWTGDLPENPPIPGAR
jgi:hypothetical protein